MADLVKDYDASDANLKMTDAGAAAMLLFLTTEGWVGVTLGRDDLVRLQDRIHLALSAQVPHDRRR
jgi:hypothetical protein